MDKKICFTPPFKKINVIAKESRIKKGLLFAPKQCDKKIQ